MGYDQRRLVSDEDPAASEGKIQYPFHHACGFHDAMEVELVERALVSIQVALAAGSQASAIRDKIGGSLRFDFTECQIGAKAVLHAALLVAACRRAWPAACPPAPPSSDRGETDRDR